jgi:hypothetical protein
VIGLGPAASHLRSLLASHAFRRPRALRPSANSPDIQQTHRETRGLTSLRRIGIVSDRSNATLLA